MNLNLELTTMPLGGMGTNCYILSDSASGDAYVFDPGDEADYLLRYLDQKGLKLCGIILTHGHFDHILAVDDLLKAVPGIPVYANKEEKVVFENRSYNLCGMVGGKFNFMPTNYVEDGEILEILGTKVKCLHTPGHTCGGMCYFIEDKWWLIAGDTLFQASIGRTDFPTGSFKVLAASIREKIYTLPDWVKVFPGHGPATTVEEEKHTNMFVRALDD